MVDLRYLLGGIDIDPAQLELEAGKEEYESAYKFIIKLHEETRSAILFASKATKHYEVRNRFELSDNQIAGGGSLYTRKQVLFLGDFSAQYGTLPKEVSERFAALTMTHLVDTFHLQLTEAIGQPTDSGLARLHPIWQ